MAGYQCRMAAIPTGGDPGSTNLATYSGPQAWGGGRQTYRFSAGRGNENKLNDFYFESARPGIYNDYLSIGSCGLCDTRLIDPVSGALGSKYLWYDNAASYRTHSSGGPERPYITVDGQGVYTATSQKVLDSKGLTGGPGLSASMTQDPTTGDVTIVEDDVPTTCPAFPPAGATCTTFASATVAVKRTIVEDLGGFRVRITDEWRSLDGQPHALDIDADEYQQSNALGFRFPGDATYGAAGAADSTRTGFPALTTIGFSSDRLSPASLDEPVGTLTTTPSPTQALFTSSVNGFLLRHVVTVPATGVATIRRVYVIAADEGTLATRTAAARDLIEAPQVAIDALPATVSAAALKVTGTASDSGALQSVTVNGAPVAVTGTTWSADLALTPGPNTITAVATDGQGNATTATASVTYAVPSPPSVTPPVVRPPALRAPTIATSGRPSARTVRGRTSVAIGRRITCPAGTTPCRTTVTATASGRRVGRTTVTTRPARSTTLRVTLTRSAAKTLRAKGRLRLRVTVVTTAGTARATRTLSFTVRRR
jgi:hypothetical protein